MPSKNGRRIMQTGCWSVPFLIRIVFADLEMQGPNGRILPLPSDVRSPHQSLLFQPTITGVEEIPIRVRDTVRRRHGRAQYRQQLTEM